MNHQGTVGASLLETIRMCHARLQEEGFFIDAIFGSCARGESRESSDIDLLYHVDRNFLKKYGGFTAMKRVEEIKRFLEEALNRKVDLVPSNNLSETGKKYIFESIVYV